VLGAIAATLVAAPPAHAATAFVDGRVLRLEAAPGESNQITLNTVTGTGALTISGTGITPGAGCVAANGGVDCALTGFDSIVVDLGVEADRLSTLVDEPIATSVSGGAGNDELYEGGGADRLDGGPGDDTLHAWRGSGADEYVGGDGTDLVFFSSRFASQSISLDGVANDGFAGELDNVRADIEAVHGGDGNDTLTGSDGDDGLHGGPGSDVVDGAGGDDVLDGGFSCTNHDLVLGGAGDDTLHFGKGATVDGGADDDRLRPESVNCPPLASTVRGGTGVDTADLRDLYQVTISLDDVANDADDDVDNYRSDIENLTAGDSDMTLIGSAGPNVLTGGEGNDLLDGRGGADSIVGGDGYDLADYSARTAAVSLTLDGVANDGEAGEQDSLDVEDLRGGAGDDTLIGDDEENYLDGGRGADVMRGGAGFDFVDYFDRTSAVTVDLDGEQPDDGEANERDTVGPDVEGVIGGSGDDVITGSAGDHSLYGGDGDDRIVDTGGEDLLDGGDGDDVLLAADGAADSVECGLGEDEVEFDEIDALSDECELPSDPEPTPTATPVATATATPSTPALPQRPPTTTPRDTVAPAATLRAPARARARTMRSRGVTLTLTCGELCRASFELKAVAATARTLERRRVSGARGVMARGSLRLGGPPTRRLTLKLTADGRRALGRVPAGRYVLTVKVSDFAGNVRTITRTLRFTR